MRQRYSSGIVELRRRVGTRPVIGITGSYAKTSTKHLLSACLAPQYDVVSNAASYNVLDGIHATLRRVTSRTDLVIQEIGATGPGSLDGLLFRLLPTFGVLTAIADDHLGAFGNRATVLREKLKLIQSLPKHGTAIMNVDDPLIADSVDDIHCGVRTFGRSRSAQFRAIEVSARWPEYLTFDLLYGTDTYRVKTRLFGEHSIVCVLASIAAAEAVGADLGKFIRQLADVPNARGRMEQHVRSDGKSIMLDHYKATSYMMEDVIAFLRQANASNRYLILGQLSDSPGKAGRNLRAIAATCRQSGINLITFGGLRKRMLRKQTYGFDSGVGVFESALEVAEFIDNAVSSDDLVYIKSSKSSKLERIVLAETMDVRCRALSCGRSKGCADCPELGSPNAVDYKFAQGA